MTASVGSSTWFVPVRATQSVAGQVPNPVAVRVGELDGEPVAAFFPVSGDRDPLPPTSERLASDIEQAYER